jgi:hypothetical protein
MPRFGTPQAKSRIANQVADELLAQRIRKAKAAKAAAPHVGDAKEAQLAMANSEESHAAICDRNADSAHRRMLATSMRDLINYYAAQEQEHRREAEQHRANARAHRLATGEL